MNPKTARLIVRSRHHAPLRRVASAAHDDRKAGQLGSTQHLHGGHELIDVYVQDGGVPGDADTLRDSLCQAGLPHTARVARHDGAVAVVDAPGCHGRT